MKRLLIGVALMLSLSLFATEKPCERRDCRMPEVVSIGVLSAVETPCDGDRCAIETETELACDTPECVVNPCDTRDCKEVWLFLI